MRGTNGYEICGGTATCKARSWGLEVEWIFTYVEVLRVTSNVSHQLYEHIKLKEMNFESENSMTIEISIVSK